MIGAHRPNGAPEIVKRRGRRPWIRSKHLPIRDATNAEFTHHVECRGSRSRVGECGDAGPQSFEHAKPGAGDKIVRLQLGTCTRERADPLEERQLFEQPAHDREIEMCVGVDESRYQDRLTKIPIGRIGRRRLSARAHPFDSIAICYDGSVFNRRRRDGQHPARMVAHAAGCGRKNGNRHGVFGVAP